MSINRKLAITLNKEATLTSNNLHKINTFWLFVGVFPFDSAFSPHFALGRIKFNNFHSVYSQNIDSAYLTCKHSCKKSHANIRLHIQTEDILEQYCI